MKLNLVASQVEDMAKSMLALASDDYCIEVTQLAGAYCVIG
jgi:hypothetical protein